MNIRPGGTCGDSGDLSPVMLYTNTFTLFQSVCKGTDKSGANISNHSCSLRMGIVLSVEEIMVEKKKDRNSLDRFDI